MIFGARPPCPAVITAFPGITAYGGVPALPLDP